MLGDDEIAEMQEEIKQLEEQVRLRKKELHEKRFSGLKQAIEARKLADQEIAKELRQLGYKFYNHWTM